MFDHIQISSEPLNLGIVFVVSNPGTNQFAALVGDVVDSQDLSFVQSPRVLEIRRADLGLRNLSPLLRRKAISKLWVLLPLAVGGNGSQMLELEHSRIGSPVDKDFVTPISREGDLNLFLLFLAR